MSYVVLDKLHNGMQVIKLTCEQYGGIIYSYGKVSFSPDETNDKLTIKFDYDILEKNNKEFDNEQFERHIGDILQEIIQEGVKSNSLTYTGGVDEN